MMPQETLNVMTKKEVDQGQENNTEQRPAIGSPDSFQDGNGTGSIRNEVPCIWQALAVGGNFKII